jgi:hypothetical protein
MPSFRKAVKYTLLVVQEAVTFSLECKNGC